MDKFKVNKKTVVLIICVFVFYLLFFAGYNFSSELKDATVNSQTGELAIAYYEKNIVVSTYDASGALLYSVVVDDQSGGRYITVLWYENNILNVEMAGDVLVQIDSNGTILSKEKLSSKSDREPWQTGWKKALNKQTTDLDGTIYCYDNKNFLSRRFLKQRRTMSIIASSGVETIVWQSDYFGLVN